MSWLVLRGVYNNLISGPAAVIVFFIISGFCIHFPFRHTRRVALLPYYARRHIRILVPAGAAILLAHQQDLSLSLLENSILWSLVCEEIYYTIYPALLVLRSLWGWNTLIAMSFVAAAGVVATEPFAPEYPSFGWKLNWVLGLPCWLMGCRLAERWESLLAKGRVQIRAVWSWRVGVLLLSATCSVLRFHSPLTYPWTLNFFALVAALWIDREIRFAVIKPPPRLLEWAGGFSFAIYLVHRHGQKFIADHAGLQPTGFLTWMLVNLAVLFGCYVFYRLVEKPSHQFARFVYRTLMGSRVRSEIVKARVVPDLP